MPESSFSNARHSKVAFPHSWWTFLVDMLRLVEEMQIQQNICVTQRENCEIATGFFPSSADKVVVVVVVFVFFFHTDQRHFWRRHCPAHQPESIGEWWQMFLCLDCSAKISPGKAPLLAAIFPCWTDDVLWPKTEMVVLHNE